MEVFIVLNSTTTAADIEQIMLAWAAALNVARTLRFPIATFIRELGGWSVTKTLGFCAAGLAEIAKRVDQPAIRHLPQLWESLVRLQISIDYLFHDLVGAVDDPC